MPSINLSESQLTDLGQKRNNQMLNDLRPLFEESKNQIFNQSRTIQTLLGDECETEHAFLNEFGEPLPTLGGQNDLLGLPSKKSTDSRNAASNDMLKYDSTYKKHLLQINSPSRPALPRHVPRSPSKSSQALASLHSMPHLSQLPQAQLAAHPTRNG